MMKSEECRVKSEAHWTIGDAGPSPRPLFVYKLKNSSMQSQFFQPRAQIQSHTGTGNQLEKEGHYWAFFRHEWDFEVLEKKIEMELGHRLSQNLLQK